MAKRRRTPAKSEVSNEPIIDLIEAREQAQSFFEKNQRIILGALTAIVVLVGGYIAYKMLYIAPREKQAVSQMFRAEQAFEQDSLTKALTDAGGGYPGFIKMVEDYGSTNAGDVSNLYAAISYLKLGKYDVAIDYLKDYDGSGKIGNVIKLGLMGDAYSELGKLDQALSYYKKAAKYGDNEFLAPYYLYKAGLLSEHLGKKKEAAKFYEEIRLNYPNSVQGQGIEKFIERVSE